MAAGSTKKVAAETVPTDAHAARVGLLSAAFTALATLVAFALALAAIPISGANCPSGCVEYPYLDTVGQYPRDFLWMPPAMLALLGYVALIACLHAGASDGRRVVSRIALSFALLSAAILLPDYYLQFTVVPASLASAETQGLPMLIQYNPHGVFIALEELGYVVMGLSFLCAGISMEGTSRLERTARWVFIVGFVLAALSVAVVSAIYGRDRLDRLEVLVVSVSWLVLIVNGIELSFIFQAARRQP